MKIELIVLHCLNLETAILDFLISPKPQKTVQIGSKFYQIIKTNKQESKWCKSVNVTRIDLKFNLNR